MDTVFVALILIGAVAFFYILIFRVALQAGKEYPENVRVPAILDALGILACGAVLALQVFGYMGGQTTAYAVSLMISLVVTLGAMWLLATRL